MFEFKVADTTPEPVINPSRHIHPTGDTISHTDEYQNNQHKPGYGKILNGTKFAADVQLVAQNNGFVDAVFMAYNRHHKLVIRPDDVWLAIGIQFGFFVNGHAEEMRHLFVQHEGKKTLNIHMGTGTLATCNYGEFARLMVDLLRENVSDAGLCDWMLPDFSTTTYNDTVVGSVSLMISMKAYFDFGCTMCCGIPSVQLIGTVEDWQEIRKRVDRLSQYGKECEQWMLMLRVVVDQFVQAADHAPDIDFWQRVCHHESGMSGPSYLSGWITAFTVWDKDGKWIGRRAKDINGAEFPVIETDLIAPGYGYCDVIVNDNGAVYNTVMFAGHSTLAVHSNDETAVVLNPSWAIVLNGKESTPASVIFNEDGSVNQTAYAASKH